MRINLKYKTSSGKFNDIIEGKNGIITTKKNWSQKSIDRIAKNYGWQFEK
jgi:hypothetical protein